MIRIWRRNEAGQFTVLDIILFGFILLLASSIQIYAVNQTMHYSELSNDRSLGEYAERALTAFLETTIDLDTIEQGYRPISELYAELLIFSLDDGKSFKADSSALKTASKIILNNLTRPDFGYWFEAALEGSSLVISSTNSDIPTINENIVYADRAFELVHEGQLRIIEFRLTIWRL